MINDKKVKTKIVKRNKQKIVIKIDDLFEKKSENT